ncbi:MAG: MarP family serine protease [Actinomycetes bacterium]
MSGDLLDVILVIAIVSFAVSGYRQGFVVGALAFAGFIGGAVIGVKVAPSIASALVSGAARSIVAIVVVVVLASLGELAAATGGAILRRRVVWRPARALDSALGAAISVVSLLLVAWIIGSALAKASYRGLARQVNHSWVMQHVDDAIPLSVHDFFATFFREVEAKGFPPVFGGLGSPRVPAVSPPDPAVLGSPAVRRDRASIVKLQGLTRCHTRLEGSGFIYAPDRVMTNAHVVAGVTNLHVLTGGGTSYSARVVLYDPNRDIAVVAVPGLPGGPLAFAGKARDGSNAVVVGYPENGPFTANAARVRGTQETTSPNIYQHGNITRQIYAIRAVVRPGNSGGPLLATDGRVFGVVFAASTDNNDTGFVLTAAEVASDARAGASASQDVSTQGCR